MQSPGALRKQPTVVGIGASAGGLAALKTFFDHIPPDCGLAFVVVVHLSPEHKSHLADLLQPHVRFPVQQVTENTPLEANHVYIIPPNANLNAIDTHLRLSKLEEHRRERAPIDYFFRTLATAQDGHCIAIILTGTGSDGTLGIQEVKSRGGIVFVQDPSEAEYDGMPQSAIASGMVDRVLPVNEIAETILRIDRTQPQVAAAKDWQELPNDSESISLQRAMAHLRVQTGRDFSRYKQATILRRIGRRMQLNYVEDLEAYLEKLRQDPEEVRVLADDLLITVTSFFRDPEVFEYLSKEVAPRLFDGKGAGDSVRVWSVGCATGEEAYSLAILLSEEAARRKTALRIQVFASDLHRRSLDKAREGFYPGDIETDVGDERLRRFFQKEDGGFRIRKEIRDLVVFAPHNLLADPPFSRIDLIACRNLLIYLQRSIQRDVIELFHYALKPEGFLILGSAESADAPDLFRTESKRLCFYRKLNVPGPEPRLPVFPLNRTWTTGSVGRLETAEPVAYGAIHQLLLDRYGPPSLLVSPENRVVHLSEQVGRYLVHPGGELTANVFKLIRDELRIELQTALRDAREKRRPVESVATPVAFNGHPKLVTMQLRPALEAQQEGFVLVLFEELEEKPDSEATGRPSPDVRRDAERISELEAELSRAKQRLQAVIEEYETGQEEMKSANEELQSTNEELRSTMEELETSKEELQSINEELQTVNQENRHKVEEFTQLNADLQNLLASTDIATLFLDRGLRILRFTPAASGLFNIRTADRGRPLFDLNHKIRYPELQADAESVLNRLIPIEREVQDEAGKWYLTRVLPYRSTDDRIEGVVVTFVDISARKQVEAALQESEQRFRLFVENVHEYALFQTDAEGKVTSWNPGAERLFGYTGSEMLGQSAECLLTPEDRDARVFEKEIAKVLTGEQQQDARWLVRKDGSRFWAQWVTEPVREETGRLRGVAKLLRDETDRMRAEEALKQSLAEKEALLKEVHHRVKNNLQVITSLLNLQAQQIQDEKTLAQFEVARNRVQSIASIHELLYRSASFASIEVGVYTEKLVAEVVRSYGAEKRIEVSVSADGASVDLQRAVPFGLLLNELVSNVCKHAFPAGQRGTLAVNIAKQGGQLAVTVADSGVGLPSDFEDKQGTRLGIYLVRRLANQLRARIAFQSGNGTSVQIRVPLTVTREMEEEE